MGKKNKKTASSNRRTGGSSSRRGRATAGAGGAGGILQFYTDEAPGLKIGPTTVLIGSLVFIGCVVLLHIWGKFRK